MFGGFASKELAVRIDDATPKLIISASCGIEPSRKVPYKPLLDEAIELARHKPEHCIVLQRPMLNADLISPRDFDWDDVMSDAEPVDCVEVESNHPLYILYTSGTTGQPKGVVRDTGGYIVALKWSMSNIYDVRPGDVYWAASDVGWVVGHSYIVYGPLFHGNTTVLYEGKPVGTPDPRFFLASHLGAQGQSDVHRHRRRCVRSNGRTRAARALMDTTFRTCGQYSWQASDATPIHCTGRRIT